MFKISGSPSDLSLNELETDFIFNLADSNEDGVLDRSEFHRMNRAARGIMVCYTTKVERFEQA